MQLFGDMSRQGLAALSNIGTSGDEPPAFGTRVFDTNGDGRSDLMLVDSDNDGTVDGVVRGVDTNADGINDTFIQYNEDGTIVSIGRVNPATGELEIVYEEPDFFDKLLDFLGLSDLDPPEKDLFTTFDDPYIYGVFGTYGVEAVDDDIPSVTIEPDDIEEVATGALSEENGVTVLGDAGPTEEPVGMGQTDLSGVGSQDQAEASSSADDSLTQPDEPTDSPDDGATVSSENTPRVTELKAANPDGSTMWARVDTDGDNLADREELVTKSGDTWYGDINQDGYSDKLATDADGDGRIDSVDTTGQGLSGGQADPSRIVSPDAAHLVDQHPGEDDSTSETPAGEPLAAEPSDSWSVSDSDDASQDLTTAPDQPSSVEDSFSVADSDTLESPDIGPDIGIDNSDYSAGSSPDIPSSSVSSYDPGPSVDTSTDSGSSSP